jgi:hypothetical protein
MSATSSSTADLRSAREPAGQAVFGLRLGRPLFVLALGAGLALGFVVTGADREALAVQQAGADLTRLLRGMALLKVLLAAAVATGVFWRLGHSIGRLWLAAYVVAGVAMAAGPGLIWDMVYVRTGAVLLHGGLVAALILLLRDRGAAARLSSLVAARARR